MNGGNIKDVRYARNTAPITDSEKKQQGTVEEIVTESEKFGLSLNVEKALCVITSKKQQAPMCPLKSSGEVIKHLEKL